MLFVFPHEYKDSSTPFSLSLKAGEGTHFLLDTQLIRQYNRRHDNHTPLGIYGNAHGKDH
jgi:hypothetical protein